MICGKRNLGLFSIVLLLLVPFLTGAQTPAPSNTIPRNVTGHYRLRQEEFRNRLDVQQLPGGKIKFYLLALWVSYNNPENIHNGEIQGIARLENGMALYEADQCKVTMKFLPNRVVVTQTGEAECGFGANVTATGSYRRVDNKKTKFEF